MSLSSQNNTHSMNESSGDFSCLHMFCVLDSNHWLEWLLSETCTKSKRHSDTVNKQRPNFKLKEDIGSYLQGQYLQILFCEFKRNESCIAQIREQSYLRARHYPSTSSIGRNYHSCSCSIEWSIEWRGIILNVTVSYYYPCVCTSVDK